MALSPMMQHYLQIKEKYKDCVIFYRLGDFYEMFFDDAVKVSSLLELTLTGRDCGLEERAPMCGIPFHSADTYIAKLVSMGEKVAICEQLTSPNGKDLVQRDVVKIVTAGTVINDELIDDKTNNFISSVFLNENKCAFAWADITTGEFFVKSFSGNTAISELTDQLVRTNPAEIISNAKANEIFKDMPLVVHEVIPRFYVYSDAYYNLNNAESVLKEHFKVSTLSAFNIEKDFESISCAGALISYLQETQKHALKNICSIRKEIVGKNMMLDVNAVCNLELVKTLREGKRYGSLLWLLDKTKTSMGARKLQSWILSPLNNKSDINYRLDAVEQFTKNTLIRQSLIALLSTIKDIGRLSGKISNGNLEPKDCNSLARSLEVLPNLKFQLLGCESQMIKDISDKLHDFSDVCSLISSAIVDECEMPSNTKQGGYIRKGYNNQLDELNELRQNSKNIIAEIEQREREKTGAKTLKIAYNRVFGYYIELTNSVKHLAPYDYIRRQTLAGSERYITEELKGLEEKILSSEEKSINLENYLFGEIKSYLLQKISLFQETADAIAELDVLLAFANISKQNNYVKPEISDDELMEIVDGRHPVVEAISKQRYIPNDTILDNSSNRTMVITGPNMAGKSTYMRQVALITLMAHIGCFVPASSAIIPVTDRIFTRIGASDNLILDQSTFMVEMTEISNIILNATKKSLLILDEVGRGTSTFDGLSIAWAVVEYLTNVIQAKTMFATHYHELTELEGVLEGVKNYKVTVKELQGGIVFLRKIMRGGANKSFGIEVAELAGVSKEVTLRAKEILKRLEKSDITKTQSSVINNTSKQVKLSETERIIKDLDLNNLSPMQAFNILAELKEKVEDNE